MVVVGEARVTDGVVGAVLVVGWRWRRTTIGDERVSHYPSIRCVCVCVREKKG